MINSEQQQHISKLIYLHKETMTHFIQISITNLINLVSVRKLSENGLKGAWLKLYYKKLYVRDHEYYKLL